MSWTNFCVKIETMFTRCRPNVYCFNNILIFSDITLKISFFSCSSKHSTLMLKSIKYVVYHFHSDKHSDHLFLISLCKFRTKVFSYLFIVFSVLRSECCDCWLHYLNENENDVELEAHCFTHTIKRLFAYNLDG